MRKQFNLFDFDLIKAHLKYIQKIIKPNLNFISYFTKINKYV